MYVVGDVGIGAYQAAGGQGLGSHLQGAPLGRFAQIPFRKVVKCLLCSVGQVEACFGRYPLPIGTEVTPFDLKPDHIPQTGALRQQLCRQVQQLASPGVELAHPAIGVDQHDALADAGQCGLQQQGVFLQLRVERAQFAFGELAV